MQNSQNSAYNFISKVLFVAASSILTNNDIGALSIAVSEAAENDLFDILSSGNTHEYHDKYLDHF